MKDIRVLPKDSQAELSRSVNGSQCLLRDFRPTIKDRLMFLGAFLRRPVSVGALGPSSPHLAEAMLSWLVPEESQTVVELGPGTGAFTGLILRRIRENVTFFALELDPGFTRGLRSRFPSLTVYNDSAEKIPEYLSRHGKLKADYIVCGLPWASLPLGVQDRVLAAVLSSLSPGGHFVTFGYVHARWLPNAQRFRRRLEQNFNRVETSRVVWKNFPPAFIYRCVR